MKNLLTFFLLFLPFSSWAWDVRMECNSNTFDVELIIVQIDMEKKEVFTESTNEWPWFMKQGKVRSVDPDDPMVFVWGRVDDNPTITDTIVRWNNPIYGGESRALWISRDTLRLSGATTGQWTGQSIPCYIFQDEDVPGYKEYLINLWNEKYAEYQKKLKKRAF